MTVVAMETELRFLGDWRRVAKEKNVKLTLFMLAFVILVLF